MNIGTGAALRARDPRKILQETKKFSFYSWKMSLFSVGNSGALPKFELLPTSMRFIKSLGRQGSPFQKPALYLGLDLLRLKMISMLSLLHS